MSKAPLQDRLKLLYCLHCEQLLRQEEAVTENEKLKKNRDKDGKMKQKSEQEQGIVGLIPLQQHGYKAACIVCTFSGAESS